MHHGFVGAKWEKQPTQGLVKDLSIAVYTDSNRHPDILGTMVRASERVSLVRDHILCLRQGWLCGVRDLRLG